MTDCVEDLMRDELPGYAHGTLDATTRARVEAHLATCAACRAELATIRRVNAAWPTPSVDVSRIVRALPAPPAAAATSAERDATVLPFRRRERAASTQRSAGRVSWARAATIGALMLGGGASWALLRHDPDAPVARTAIAPSAPESAATVAIRTPETTATRAIARATPTRAPVVAGAAEASLGGMLGDLSAAETEALVRDLESFEALPSAEPGGVLPAVEGMEGDEA